MGERGAAAPAMAIAKAERGADSRVSRQARTEEAAEPPRRRVTSRDRFGAAYAAHWETRLLLPLPSSYLSLLSAAARISASPHSFSSPLSGRPAKPLELRCPRCAPKSPIAKKYQKGRGLWPKDEQVRRNHGVQQLSPRPSRPPAASSGLRPMLPSSPAALRPALAAVGSPAAVVY